MGLMGAEGGKEANGDIRLLYRKQYFHSKLFSVLLDEGTHFVSFLPFLMYFRDRIGLGSYFLLEG